VHRKEIAVLGILVVNLNSSPVQGLLRIGTGLSGLSVQKVSFLGRSAALRETSAYLRMLSVKDQRNLSGQSGASVNLGSKRERNVKTVFACLTQGCAKEILGQIGVPVVQMVVSQEQPGNRT